jgi:hypothetical protein
LRDEIAVGRFGPRGSAASANQDRIWIAASGLPSAVSDLHHRWSSGIGYSIPDRRSGTAVMGPSFLNLPQLKRATKTLPSGLRQRRERAISYGLPIR